MSMKVLTTVEVQRCVCVSMHASKPIFCMPFHNTMGVHNITKLVPASHSQTPLQ